MKDISFLDSSEGVRVMPLKLTGTCTGRSVLAQKVVTMLLSSTNDVARFPSTGIASDVGSSNLAQGEELIRNELNLAAADIKEIIQSDQVGRSIPDDEVLEFINFANIVINEDSLTVEVEVVTRAGQPLYTSFEL